MSTSQTALVVPAIGQPLIKISRPIPTPGSGEIQVRVTVAGLNPHDATSRATGLFISSSLPAVLAGDVTGVITAVGPDVTGFEEGDHVVGHGILGNPDYEGLQEYSLLQAAASMKVPKGFSDSQLATLPTNLIAPVVGFFDPSALGIPAPWSSEAKDFDYAGTKILIVGGGSNTGRFAVQLARLVGLGTIVVVASPKNSDELISYGATHIVDRHLSTEGVLKEIKNIVGDDLIYAFDAINTPDGQVLTVDALSDSKKGILARLRPHGPIDETKLTTKKAAGFEVKNVFGVSYARPETCIPFWSHLTQYLEEGKIIPLREFQVVQGLDVDAVNAKLDGYQNGTVIGHVQVEVGV